MIRGTLGAINIDIIGVHLVAHFIKADVWESMSSNKLNPTLQISNELYLENLQKKPYDSF